MNAPDARPVSRTTLVVVTLALFLVWSNTFLAFEVLLAPRTGPAPLDWFTLTVARFAPVAVACALWCFAAHPRESWEIVRAHPWRLLACGFLVVPAYNFSLYHAMQQRVAGPIASLVTTLAPLYLVLLGAAFLGERITLRKAAGLALGFGGMALIALSRPPGADTRAWQVFEAALAPLAWSVHTVLTRPVAKARSPVLWTCLVLVVGTLLVLPMVPFAGMPDVVRLGTKELALLGYLAFAATIGGFAVWSWLLRHLPASTAGLTIFLNPPLTLVSKIALATLLPASFVVAISAQEWLGGAVMLAGVAFAVAGARRPDAAPDDGAGAKRSGM